MPSFQQLPKSVKKTIRYILQDVHSLERSLHACHHLEFFIENKK